MNVSTPKPATGPQLPDGFEPRLLSFDVYGTLINTPPANLGAFRAILEDAGRPDLDPNKFYSFWEKRNIAHYYEPYRTYKDICRLSLSEAYERFGVVTGRKGAIQRYFDCFSSMELYPDVLPTLDVLARRHKLALVSNIDDDLLNMTPLGREFDLVCTAEKARGYKPDGTLFRYLLEASGLPVSHILHSGQSQFTDMVGGKPLGLTIAWINRRGLDLDPGVPPPDLILSGLQPLCGLLGDNSWQTIS
ncbi:HAD hydrolase-like protein [Sodalis sp. dw_96]|uniref:HAD family hydrolase n=1 Tax=Sodalis sp. dw_96 TaxID=2719794 RepID=UPI001BD5F7B9|nr:HAD hydrolase-like protein [Sodalis sp. dw_96]